MADGCPPEREVKDFFFKQLVKLRLRPSPGTLPTDRVSQLALSNKYGMAFAANENGFCAFKMEQIFQKATQMEKNLQNLSYCASVTLGSSPSHLCVSSDDSTLAVCVKQNGCLLALLYDIKVFADDAQMPPTPFATTELGVTELIDFAWNPGTDFSAMFAACTSDGALTLFEVRDTVRAVSSLPAATAVRALCWSPKGKQLVAGKMDGTLVQYDQQLKPRKQVPCPPLFQGPMSVLDVCWQSTQVFVAAYVPASGDTKEPPCLVFVTVPKGENPTFVQFDDVCFGSGEDRKHKYYMTHIAEWEMILAASANALEAGVIGRHPENKALWERWSLEDSGRAELPLTDDFSETMPVGTAVCYTSQTPVPLSDSQVLPPSPLFLLLSTDGVLVGFHMVNQRPGAVALTRAPELLTFAGARPGKGGMAIPSTPSAPHQGAPPNGISSVAKVLFQTPKPAGTAEGSSVPAAKPAGLFGSNPPQVTTSVPPRTIGMGQFGSANVPPASNTNSAFTLGVAATPLSFSFTKPLNQSTPLIAPLPSQPPGGAPGAAFSFAPKAAPTQTTETSQGFLQNPNTSFGLPSKPANSVDKPRAPATVVPQVKPGAVAETKPMGMHGFGALGGAVSQPAGTSAPAPFSGNAPVSTSTAPLAKPTVIQSALPTSQSAVSLETTKPSSAFSYSSQQTVQGAKRLQGGAQAQPQLSQQQLSQQSSQQAQPQPRPTLKPQTKRTSESSPGSADNPFLKSIVDEIAHFSQELKELAARSHGVSALSVMTGTEKESLRVGTEKMGKFCRDIKDTTQELNNDIHQLKSDTLEGFALLEECRVRERQDLESAYQELVRSRALDPASARLMKNIHSQHHYIDSGIREVDLRLDGEWEQYQRSKNNARRLQTPVTDTIYRTLGTNHNILSNQSHAIEKLCADLQEMRLYNMNSVWQAAHSPFRPDEKGDTTKLQELNALIPAMMTSASPSRKLPPSPVSPEKQARLRDILSKRRVTPIRSTAPGNLSMSKIVSAEELRRMLSEDKENEEDVTPVSTPRASGRSSRMTTVSTPIRDLRPSSPHVQLKTPPLPSIPAFTSVKATPSGGPGHSPAAAGVLQPQTPVLKPVSKPATPGLNPASPVQPPDSMNKPTTGFPLLPPGDINIGQSQAFTGSSLKVMQERPSDPAAKVITQNAAAFGKPENLAEVAEGESPAVTQGVTGYGLKVSIAANPAASGSGTLPSFGFSKPPPGGSTTFSFGGNLGAPAKPGAGFAGFSLPPSSAGGSTGGIGKLTTGTTVSATATPSVDTTSGTTATTSSPAPIGLKTIESVRPSQYDVTVSDIEDDDEDDVPHLLGASYVTSSEEWESIATVTLRENVAKTDDGKTDPGVSQPAGGATGFSFGGSAGSAKSSFSFTAAASETATSGVRSAAETTTANSGVKLTQGTTATDGKFLFGISPLPSGTGLFGAPSKPLFGGSTTSTSTASSIAAPSALTSAMTFGATVVSGAGAMGANPAANVPVSSWKPILGATPATTGGSLTSGKPMFGAMAATITSSSSSSVPGAAAAASAAAPPTVTTVTSDVAQASPAGKGPTAPISDAQVTSSGDAAGAAVAAVAVEPAATSTPPSNTSAAGASTSLSGVTTTTATTTATGATPASSINAPPVATTAPQPAQLFGQPGSAAPSAFGAAAGLKTVAADSTTAAAATITAANTPAAGFSFTLPTTGASAAATTTASTTAAGFSFTLPPTTTTTTTATTTATTLFGKPASGAQATTTSTTSLFGAASASTSLFGGGQTTPSTIFGNQSASSSPAAATPTTTTSSAPLFGTSQPTTTSSGGTTSLFGNPVTGGTSVFGNTPVSTTSAFKTAATTTDTKPAFGGQSAQGAGFTFGGSATFGQSPFGQSAAGSSSSSTFGQQGAQPFGQSAVFGNQTPTSSASAFGQATAPSSGASTFGGSGGGGFFSGLGGKPSAENANKNVFGGNTGFGGSAGGTSLGGSGLFGTSSSTFGAPKPGLTSSGFGGSGGAFGGGASGGAFSGGGSVVSSGFGSFQQTAQGSTSPPVSSPGAFGGAPAFGSAPVFSSPRFGSPPAFGGGAAFGSPMGGGAMPADKPAFGGFSGGGTSTFGALAQQSSAPTFGALAQHSGGGFGSPTPGFGSPSGGMFGGTTESPSFGGGAAFGNSPGFGTSPGQGSSFTSYRS